MPKKNPKKIITNPYGIETTYALAKVWLKTHNFVEVKDHPEYGWLEFYLGELNALYWTDFYLECKSDDEIRKGVEEYEKENKGFNQRRNGKHL